MTLPSSDRQLDMRALARGLRVTIVGRFGGRASTYVAQIVLGRVLGPASYGVYSLAWKIVLIVALLASLGMEHAVVRFGSSMWSVNPEKLSALVRRCLGVAFIGSAVGAFAVYLSSWTLADAVFDMPRLAVALQLFAMAVCLLCLMKVAAAATRVSREMSYSVLAEDVVQAGAQLFFLVVFLGLGYRLLGAVAATLLSLFFGAGLALIHLRRLGIRFWVKPKTTAPSTSEILRFSLPTALAATSSLLVMWTDVVVVGIFLSEAETGVYQAATQVSVFFAIVLLSSSSIFSPLVARLMNQPGAGNDIDSLFKVSTLWTLYLTLPVFIVVAIVPELLVGVIFDERYVPGARAMIYLCIGQMINVASGAVGKLLVLSGRERTWLVASLGALVVNIALNIVLIPRLGLEGAAIATVVALTALSFAGLFLVRYHLSLWPYDRRFIKPVVASLITAAAVWVLSRLSPLTGVENLFLLSAASAVSFVGVVAMMGLGPEEIGFLRSAFGPAEKRGGPST